MEGHVPHAIFNMSSLKVINFDGNKLSGVLFPNIDISPHSIEVLYLSNNQFTGQLPPGFWKLKKIQRLEASINSFIGVIPSEVGNLTQLTHLYLGYNRLTGMFYI
ncbi:putative non-specific serine/threonine protein kinase [Helianthus annuus]|uniref:Non-specific serine/threonine protein kinase n=1 Tax=Helianthus annuus TaxID=4232 RepID=A0A251V0Q9_HELAN|nr:putative non-specific serine/threonine protein kinase [Helianthus annuus]KAJ0582035.1 putative non-specific serine/threonine protein kinase [Helianthus annuus]KAJ0590172.1 putative non-specific serine/threonine protein kinase [Helianthus annuus]KAJ0598018.1 putative non-specific serine/threonine protein kinase [Helianthus annuus]KAJ0758648.1 putative non-specific serine/threonine protein kinase [Helianthus annuus]